MPNTPSTLQPTILKPNPSPVAGATDRSFIVEILGLDDSVADEDVSKFYWDDLTQTNDASLVQPSTPKPQTPNPEPQTLTPKTLPPKPYPQPLTSKPHKP